MDGCTESSKSGLESISGWAPSWIISAWGARDGLRGVGCCKRAKEEGLAIWCSDEAAVWEEPVERENHCRSLSGAAASASHGVHSTNSFNKSSGSQGPFAIWNNTCQIRFSICNRSSDFPFPSAMEVCKMVSYLQNIVFKHLPVSMFSYLDVSSSMSKGGEAIWATIPEQYAAHFEGLQTLAHFSMLCTPGEIPFPRH